MSCRLLQSTSFVTSSRSSATAQKSKGLWPPEEDAKMKSPRWSARRHMSHYYSSTLLPVGTPSAAGAAGERRGLGWGQQCIPERMTGCCRSDRSQPWLMKPKHFHRCFYRLGSTSSHQSHPSSLCPPLLNWRSGRFHLPGRHILTPSCNHPPFPRDRHSDTEKAPSAELFAPTKVAALQNGAQVLFFSDLTGSISRDLGLKASFQRPWTWARLVPSTYQQSLH